MRACAILASALVCARGVVARISAACSHAPKGKPKEMVRVKILCCGKKGREKVRQKVKQKPKFVHKPYLVVWAEIVDMHFQIIFGLGTNFCVDR